MFYHLERGVRRRFFLFFTLVFLLFQTNFARTSSAPKLLTYEELEALYESESLSAPLKAKLDTLLTTPFVENGYAAPAAPAFRSAPPLGKYLRVAFWNIERGIEFDTLEAAFTDPQKFEALLDTEKFPLNSDARREILAEAATLRAADVIVFNEVDFGMKRTEYRNVAGELARRLGMNYAFGTQFVELTPVHLTKEQLARDEAEKELSEIVNVDAGRYKGLHGIAILSRFPLENVRLVPFKFQAYDWYAEEKNGASWLEKGKRTMAKQVFLEQSLREVRRGGRTTLLADIVDERLPSGRVTIAATHLENRTKSKNRVRQLEELLATIKPIANPVIVAGDMNTSGSDLTPTSVRREMIKRFGNPHYWIKKGIQYALGFGMVEDVLMNGITFGRTMNDPTVRHIPYFSPNHGRKFFATLEDFRFADGGAFDFRGEETRSTDGKSKTLANSNERGGKGFVTTYQVKRPVYTVGKYKLDWIFIKPANLKNPRDKKQSYQFAPHFGQTLRLLNEAVENRISDHRPLTVDLPLAEPPRENFRRK